MDRRAARKAGKAAVAPSSEGAGLARGVRLPAWAWVGGAVCLVIAGAAAGALVWQHFTGVSLPGCGPQSACAGIEGHPMGKAPLPRWLAGVVGFERWPASFLGVTFFAGLLVFWLASAGRVTAGLRAVVLAGGLVSAAYVVALVVGAAGGKGFCKYCVATHVANFGLVALMEVGMRMSRERGQGLGKVWSGALAAGAAVFVLATGALGYLESGMVARKRGEAEAARAGAERAMLEQAAAVKDQGPQGETWNFGPRGFTGRWREGPEKAVARIVIFSDYQCHQCRRIEGEARALRAKHPETVSISHKHYPWHADCNKYLGGSTLHANACWAARAAETAGVLRGNEGFWEMHRWLFDRGGGFTDQELNTGLAALGYDPQVFVSVMMSEGPLRTVREDVDEAQALGISGTPMVFINGVELKGWEAPRALERTVEAVLASGAEPATNANDRPVLSGEKYIADWRDEVARVQPPDSVRRERASVDPRVEVVVYGDFQEPNTAKVDAVLRDMVSKPAGAGGKPIRYVFRHYPGDPKCNPTLKKVFFEHGCLTARAAEAAGLVGGEDGYWKMHAWLMTNQAGMGIEAVRRGAAAVGLDADAVIAALDRPEALAAITEDVEAAAALGVGQIPCVYVDGKLVKRWWREGDDVMGRIVDEAAAGGKR